MADLLHESDVSRRALDRHRIFWNREETDRPVLGINIGFFFHEAFPRVMAKLPPGTVRPDDIPVEEFLEDCDARYAIHQ